MSESKPQKSEDSEMETYIQKIKPEKMKVFKRIKRRVIKFFNGIK